MRATNSVDLPSGESSEVRTDPGDALYEPAPAPTTDDHGYYFNGNAVRTLRRIEALRIVCGDDLAGIKIILDLTAALERLRSDIRLLSRTKTSGVRDASTISSQKRNAKSNYRRKRK